MLDAVQYQRVDFKDESNVSFMGIPTAHLEKKWDDLWRCNLPKVTYPSITVQKLIRTVGSLGIPETYLPYLNKSVSEYDWHHLPSELGGGIQAYFEGFHQIHCLVRLPYFQTAIALQVLKCCRTSYGSTHTDMSTTTAMSMHSSTHISIY